MFSNIVSTMFSNFYFNSAAIISSVILALILISCLSFQEVKDGKEFKSLRIRTPPYVPSPSPSPKTRCRYIPELDHKILSILRFHPGSTATMLHEHLSHEYVAMHQIYSRLYAMLKEHMVEKDNGFGESRWYLPKYA
jgi:hypothetical protein